MTKHIVKALEQELETTRIALSKQNLLLLNIEEWLENETMTYEDIQDRIHEADKNGEKAEDICDNPEVLYGRKECAESLLEQIEKWEQGEVFVKDKEKCNQCNKIVEDFETTEDQQVFCIDCMEPADD